MGLKPLSVIALALATTSVARAEDEAIRAAQSQAARVLVVARMAGILCPGVAVDEDEIRALMEHAQITDYDVMSPDRFGREDEATARDVKASIAQDPQFCGKIYFYLGERIHLLKRKGGFK